MVMDVPPPSGDCCSICHEDFALPCQANCSHWFCGGCILRVWHHGSALRPCKCPICRRMISLLVPYETAFNERHGEPESSRITGEIQRYNRLFGGESFGIIQRIYDLPFLLGRLVRELLDPQRSLPLILRARVILTMLVSILYVISPVDILPEAVLGVIGFFDDFLVVLIIFLHIAALYRSALVSRFGGS